MPNTASLNRSILETALTALEDRKEELDRMIAGARRGLGMRSAAKASGRTRQRVLSDEARARIAAAQRKRWAAAKKEPAVAPKKAKRVLSAEARKRIAEAQKAE